MHSAWIVIIALASILGLFIGLPVLCYLCAKLATAGALRAREIFANRQNQQQQSEKQNHHG